MELIDLASEASNYLMQESSELLLRKIKCKVKNELASSWLPYICNNQSFTQSFISYTNVYNCPNVAWKEFFLNNLPLCSFNKKYLLPTIISIHARGLLSEKESHWTDPTIEKSVHNKVQSPVNFPRKFSQESVPGNRKPAIPPRPLLKKEHECKNVKEEELLTKEVEKLVQSVQQLKLKKIQMQQEIEVNKEILTERREKDALRARILELLPDGEANVGKLQQSVEAAAQRLVYLAVQWEKHRIPLLDKYREIISLQSSRMNENVKKAETAKSLSEKRKELEIELKNKDQILFQLQSENEKNGKEVNRSAYTRRILEIINNIEKQKTEIEKVLRDTRDIQKEINTLSGQLDRSFTVADETIFRDAKKDETSRKAYKLLATLHSDCDQLVAMVQETGAILREIRDLEDQIEKEKGKNVSANLERITADLNQMKVESAQLSAQLRHKQENS